MTFDVTPIVQALIALCAVFITAVVIPYIKAKYSNEDILEFIAWVDIGVKAAEQLYNSTEGDVKKAYVLEFLASKGYRVDDIEVENAIESAVLELHAALYGDSYAGTEE